MSASIRRAVAAVLGTVLAVPLSAAALSAPAAAHEEPHVLVFSETAGFRHGSIPQGIAAVEEIGEEHGFTVDVYDPDLGEQSLESSPFTDEGLEHYDAVVWMSTTGDVLNPEEQAAFERYIEGGGGYAGVHAASDTEYSWGWYGELVGAYFSGHPEQQTATVTVVDDVHPSTSHLPDDWERYDEWYNFGSNPRGEVHVMATLDEETYDPGGGAMGRDHPITWCQYYNGGRSWYTGMGHTDESYTEANFREHLTGGVLWAAGLVENDCGGTKWSNYQKVVLDDETGSPMGLDVAPDGRVIYIERGGQVKIIDPETSTTSTAGTVPVHTEQENGLLGVALDPDFATNGWVYLYYSPPSDAIDSPRQHLSRFTLEGGNLDLASEQVILEVPHQRETCCHSGGYLQFGPDGDLWLTTGDDTSPSASDGFTPIDEREGREAYDAQRTSANTNDLRGKLLRITPRDDGTYAIPEGNLFDEAADTENLTRPEIYAMGFRNPFRFSIDERTGWAYIGDYGPDANEADPERGSDGRVEWNLVKEPGNYGWPYCHGSVPYNDYDFATGESGEPFDCANPVNDSPNNTGRSELPPVVEPTVWYGRDTPHPDIGTGGAPMGGPRYYFDSDLDSDRQWPAYFDGTVLFYEWGQNDLYEFHLSDDGEIHDITPLLPEVDLNRPHEMKFGKYDGALYAIEWGSGFGGNNPDSQVVRIDYTGGNSDPIAKVSATPTSGSVPLEVEFSSAGTAHPQGGELSYLWTFGDGATSTESDPTHTYTTEGNYTAVLTVTDVQGRTGTANVNLSVGNTAPTVEVEWPVEGGVFSYGDEIPYEITVTDPEDGSTVDGGIDCSDVTVQVILGHDDHGHPGDQFTGCSGTFVAERDDGHTDVDRITYVLEATYTDQGSPNGEVAPMTGRGLSALQPSRKQAEHHDPQDIRNEETGDPLGGDRNIGWIQDGDSASYSGVNLANIDAIRFRVASSNGTSRIEIRKDGVDGELLGTAEVPNTGGFQSWDWAEASVIDPGETFDLHLVFRGESGYLLNLNLFDFVGDGVAGGQPAFVETPVATIAPAEPDGADGWRVSPATLTLAGEDGDSFEYRTEPGAWTTYDGPVALPDGAYRVEYRAVRGEDVSRVGYEDVQLDLAAPVTSAELVGEVADGSYTGAVTLNLSTDESGSGTDSIQWRQTDGEALDYTGPVRLTGGGEQTIEYRSIDVAGNVEQWRSVTFEFPSGSQPEVSLAVPAPGGVLPAGRNVPFDVLVADDGASCEDVTVRLVLDAADASHELDTEVGCDGALTAELPEGLDANDLRAYSVEAAYAPGAGQPALSLVGAEASTTLQPHRKQAEHHDADPDIRTEATGDSAGGGLNVGWIRDGFSMQYSDVNLTGVEAMRFRIAASSAGGTLELREGSADGDLLGSLEITNTGGSQEYEWFETEVTDPGGPVTLVLVFTAEHGDYIANVNFFEFIGDGVAQEDEAPVVVAELGPAAPDGTADYYLSPVTVTLTGEDNEPGEVLVEYRIDDGDWATYTAPFTVDGDGEHTVEYRATDAAGNQSGIASSTFAIDATSPAVTVGGLEDGTAYGDSTEAVLTWEATDDLSGVVSTSGMLDGAPIVAGSTVDFSALSLGEHTVEVTATDAAGNVSVETVTFTVTTSLADLRAFVDRFRADERMSNGAASSLGAQLDKAERFAGRGRDAQVVGSLETFVRLVDVHAAGDEEMASVLRRDAAALIAQFTDGRSESR